MIVLLMSLMEQLPLPLRRRFAYREAFMLPMLFPEHVVDTLSVVLTHKNRVVLTEQQVELLLDFQKHTDPFHRYYAKIQTEGYRWPANTDAIQVYADEFGENLPSEDKIIPNWDEIEEVVLTLPPLWQIYFLGTVIWPLAAHLLKRWEDPWLAEASRRHARKEIQYPWLWPLPESERSRGFFYASQRERLYLIVKAIRTAILLFFSSNGKETESTVKECFAHLREWGRMGDMTEKIKEAARKLEILVYTYRVWMGQRM